MQYKNIAATTITNRTTDIMMKKFLMLYAFLMTALSLFAREDRVSNFEQLMRLPRIAETDMVSYPGGKCMMYRLYLRDKDLSHTPFSVSRPADFLSPRSIERRKRQNLPIDVTDLPVAPAYEQAVSEAGIEIVGKSKWNNTLLVRIHKGMTTCSTHYTTCASTLAPLYKKNVSLRYWKVTTYWAWHRPERVRQQPICSQY